MPELRCFRKECTLFVLPRLEVPTFGYELRIARSTSEDQHPMHLHRLYSRFRGPAKKEMSDLFKDAVNVMPLDRVAVDFVADDPGDTLILPPATAHRLWMYATDQL